MTFDITRLALGLISLVVAILTGVAIPWIRTRIGAQRWEQLQKIAAMMVRAAEQMGMADLIEDKITDAMTHTKKALASARLSYDDDTIRRAVEAAVLDVNKSDEILFGIPYDTE